MGKNFYICIKFLKCTTGMSSHHNILTRAMIRKLLSTLLLLTVTTILAYGQRQRNYIYVFDCTQSMEWKKIWNPAKTALDHTIQIQRLQPDALFTVIPFQSVVHPGIVFTSETYPSVRNKMNDKLDEYITAKTNTNIADALTAAFDECRNEMDNRVYLLTDGTDNVRGTAEVCSIIRKWCAKHRNTRFFYVTLAEDAVDPDIVEAVKSCNDAFFVSCHNGVIPQLADISPSTIHDNTLELGTVSRLSFSEPGTYQLKAECSDPWFRPVIIGDKAEGQTIEVKLTTRSEMSTPQLNEALAPSCDDDGNYIFRFRIVSAQPDVTIVNPEVTAVVSNRRQRSLTICGGPFDELVVRPGSSSYPSFLFCEEKLPDTVYVDLQPRFNDAAEANTSATFSVTPANKDDKDYSLLYNDESVEDDEFTIRPGENAVLGIVFDPEATSGKHYFALTPTASTELELLNGAPIDNQDGMTIRTSYSRDWNPLATACFWAAIVIFAALGLWFVVLKPIFYPKFKVGALTFMGPGSYYVRKRVRKYRMVVLTSRKRSQSFLNKLFTGSILYVPAPHWNPELVITPGNKKTCRVAQQKAWDIIPSRTLKLHETYEFINNGTDEKSKLTVE